MKNILIRILVCSSLIFSANTSAAVEETELFNNFIKKMATEHQFDEVELKKTFQSVNLQPKIIATMSKPAEGLPWHKYRKIFMSDLRINGGVKFWQHNEKTLKAVEEKYGVPAEIIIAIIGVETRYGHNTGHHRVIDALSTLAFNYPKRSKFFIKELEHFLIICREEKVSPMDPKGSYAGAMGIPQFMPSSYRAYAADFEGDDKRDLWSNPADAIASVANYFVKHRWIKGEAIVFPVDAKGEGYKKGLTKGLNPDLTWIKIQAMGVTSKQELRSEELLKLLSYEQEKGHDLWVGLNNFYVITRYNHSPLYAMAVFQLSEAIKEKRQKQQKQGSESK